MTNREELKKRILRNLSELSIDPLGAYVDSKKLSTKTYSNYEDYYYSCPQIKNIDPQGVLIEQDYQEILQAIVDEVEQNAHE